MVFMQKTESLIEHDMHLMGYMRLIVLQIKQKADFKITTNLLQPL